MALINNIYVHTKEEQVKRDLDVTEHAVEEGLPITDNVRRKPIEVSLSGYIVKAGNTKAADIISTLYGFMTKGSYVKYVGRNIMSNALITSFETSHTNEVSGGCSFTMTIKEVRIANKSYTGSSASSIKQVTNSNGDSGNRYYTVKTGDCLWTIARKYYGSGLEYPKIYNANKTMIDNRNRGYNIDKYTIYTGQKLLIP